MARTVGDLMNSLHNLQECILLNLEMPNYFTEVRVKFNYIWAEDGVIRSNLSELKIVELYFYGVQAIHIENALNDSMLRCPKSLNWGMNEVAMVVIDSETPLSDPVGVEPLALHHASVLWEWDRRIDIDFVWMEVRK
jgi:hypothetical protein